MHISPCTQNTIKPSDYSCKYRSFVIIEVISFVPMLLSNSDKKNASTSPRFDFASVNEIVFNHQ